MKIKKQTLYQVAGIVMIVGAFFNAARALGGLLSFIYVIATTRRSNEESMDNLMQSINGAHISGAFAAMASFIVLFFAGRWMLKGPKMIDRWITSAEEE